MRHGAPTSALAKAERTGAYESSRLGVVYLIQSCPWETSSLVGQGRLMLRIQLTRTKRVNYVPD